jgi:hypothetical protein|tara:strand:+ start:164 stop:913 length:750 start_codon:yes stop_codon:yes gene_type:complete
MAKPNSRTTLIEYCLRSLGAPVVEINVDDDQVEDRIDEALQLFQHYHADAIEKVFLKHQVTGTDITNGYISIPDLVTDVVSVLPIRQTNSGGGMFDLQYQMHLNDTQALGYMGSLVEYEMTQQWLALANIIMDPDEKHISFDRHKNQLRVDMDWSKEVAVNDYIIVECYRILDPETYNDVYNDYFLKRYATALIKQQWGINLSKFEGMVMPGGVTFNGRQILEDAKEELKELNEEIRLNWEQPVDFYTG